VKKKGKGPAKPRPGEKILIKGTPSYDEVEETRSPTGVDLAKGGEKKEKDWGGETKGGKGGRKQIKKGGSAAGVNRGLVFGGKSFQIRIGGAEAEKKSGPAQTGSTDKKKIIECTSRGGVLSATGKGRVHNEKGKETSSVGPRRKRRQSKNSSGDKTRLNRSVWELKAKMNDKNCKK